MNALKDVLCLGIVLLKIVNVFRAYEWHAGFFRKCDETFIHFVLRGGFRMMDKFEKKFSFPKIS